MDTTLEDLVKIRLSLPDNKSSESSPSGYQDAPAFLIPLGVDRDVIIPRFYKDMKEPMGANVAGEAANQFNTLREKSKGSQSFAHVGIGGLINFDIAGVSRADSILLCDIDARQIELWQDIIELVKEEPSREGFRERLTNSIKYGDSEFQGLCEVSLNNNIYNLFHFTEQELKNYFIHSPFLTQDKVYNHIRNLALQGRVAVGFVDLLDKESTYNARSILETSGYTVACVYSSNLSFHFREGNGECLGEYKSDNAGHFKNKLSGGTAQHLWLRATKELAGDSGV